MRYLPFIILNENLYTVACAEINDLQEEYFRPTLSQVLENRVLMAFLSTALYTIKFVLDNHLALYQHTNVSVVSRHEVAGDS